MSRKRKSPSPPPQRRAPHPGASFLPAGPPAALPQVDPRRTGVAAGTPAEEGADRGEAPAELSAAVESYLRRDAAEVAGSSLRPFRTRSDPGASFRPAGVRAAVPEVDRRGSGVAAVAPVEEGSDRGEAPPEPSGALESYLRRIAPEVVGVSFWFDPPAQPPVQSVTIRLVGQRVGVMGRRQAGDSFVHEHTVDGVVAGSGPVAVTTKVRDVNPGEWTVDAQAFASAGDAGAARGIPGDRLNSRPRPVPVHPAAWSWRRWRVTAGPAAPVRTRLAPFVRPPAVVVGSWLVLVVLGIVLALVTQSLLITTERVRLGHVLVVSLLAVLAGAVGAKAWFMVLHRRERRREGWALQGFVTAVAVTAPLLLWLLAVPVGPYLDASGPALMVGAAIGRLGCFLTGCCAGRPTASRWGVWSSNRWLGARRIPTQLLESALALAVGIAVLAVLLRVGPQQGGLFLAAVAAYTLLRQSLLPLREERRRSRLGPALIATAAAAGLVLDVVVLAPR